MLNSGQFDSKEGIKSILQSYGYPISESSDYINTAALWRNGDDPKSVAIYWKDDKCIDFVSGDKFNIKTLISLITKEKDDSILEQYVKNINCSYYHVPSLKQIKIFPNELLNNLMPVYDYWISRGIDENVLKQLRSGISNSKGIFNNKYVFPILNSKSQIVGFAGRDIIGQNKSYRWVLKGQKSNWCYPAFINSKQIINKKSVFLVESIGDLLSLYECNIKNVLVLFGTELNLSIINFLLKSNINNIFISTNDDRDGNNAGNFAAEKISKRLKKYFSNNQIKIILPKKQKDWNDVLIKEGKKEIIEQLKNYL